MRSEAQKLLESRMRGNVQVRFGVGVGMQSPGLHHVRVEPRSNNAIAARLGGSGRLRAKDRPMVNDCLSDTDFARKLHAWFGQMARVLEPGRSFYIWGGYSNIGNYPPALKACNLFFSQQIIWVKEHPVLTRKDFMGNHEWCFYGWKIGAAHHFYGRNNAPDVWRVKKLTRRITGHLTEKPIELAVRAIDYSSRPGENVLDLFAGGGFTLGGCERMGRRAFLMEIDPPYCDIIVQRWETFTGRTAKRATVDRESHAVRRRSVLTRRPVAVPGVRGTRRLSSDVRSRRR